MVDGGMCVFGVQSHAQGRSSDGLSRPVSREVDGRWTEVDRKETFR